MAVGINPNKCFRYILESDRGLPRDDQTIFLIRPVRASQYKDLIAGHNPDNIDFDKLYNLLNACIAGWENFNDQDGEAIVFREGCKLTENWDHFTLQQIAELFRAILEFNTVSLEERKN